MPKITVDRTPSDESLASSCAQMSMTSPGSSSSPRSPLSPPWSSATPNSAVAARSPSKCTNSLLESEVDAVSFKAFPFADNSGNSTGAVGAGGVAFFPGNGNGSAHGSPNSPPGNGNGLNGINNSASGVNNANNHASQLENSMGQPVIQTYQVSILHYCLLMEIRPQIK